VQPIAIDFMSGDREARDYLAGAACALHDEPMLRAHLVGDRAIAEAEFPRELRDRVEIVHAPQVVTMDESPREAIRRKKDSSMRLAIDMVADGRASACVSAGNTGALTAMAHFVLKTVDGVERAAIMSAVPSAHGHTHMLDLGANTKATPEQLRQFAFMGTVVARDVHGIANPRVGVLNIGEEDMKGHEIVQAAHALIEASGLNYVGFVEGDDIFSGDVDVVVTDGFTGNVALKTMEGVAGLIARRMREEFTASAASKVAGIVARPVLRRVAASLDPRRFNGACMVGLKGIVVKSHGGADRVAFARAIVMAATAARHQLTSHVAQALNGQGA
jgi:glycerol-3-phosphate acyltransferase PlsX